MTAIKLWPDHLVARCSKADSKCRQSSLHGIDNALLNNLNSMHPRPRLFTSNVVPGLPNPVSHDICAIVILKGVLESLLNITLDLVLNGILQQSHLPHTNTRPSLSMIRKSHITRSALETGNQWIYYNTNAARDPVDTLLDRSLTSEPRCKVFGKASHSPVALTKDLRGFHRGVFWDGFVSSCLARDRLLGICAGRSYGSLIVIGI
jgi:hypothetical protein